MGHSCDFFTVTSLLPPHQNTGGFLHRLFVTFVAQPVPLALYFVIFCCWVSLTCQAALLLRLGSGGRNIFWGESYWLPLLISKLFLRTSHIIFNLIPVRNMFYYYHHFIDKSTEIVRWCNLRVKNPNQPELRAHALNIYFILPNLLFLLSSDLMFKSMLNVERRIWQRF